MKINDFTSMVYCLSCGETKLEVAKKSSELICKSCNQKYAIKYGVPIFISLSDYEKESQPDLHKDQGTKFKYVDHYQKDGIEHDYFQERDAGTEHADRRVHEYIFSTIKKGPGRILDVGCGRAWVAEELCPKNYEVVSMDISIDNTSKALKKYPYENHSAIVADVFDLPFNENVFDYIIASEIIEHVTNPAIFVKNLVKILKPGGSLIVTTPYKEKIKYTLCVHCNTLTPLHAHLHSFDEKKLTLLYQGEEIESCEHYTFGNKLPIHLRMHIFMKFMNFWWWRKVDQVLNSFFNVPFRILVKWTKTPIK